MSAQRSEAAKRVCGGARSAHPREDLTVVAFSLRQALMQLSDGALVAITNLYDAWGDETDDPSEAVAFVAGPDERGLWWQCAIEDFGATRH